MLTDRVAIADEMRPDHRFPGVLVHCSSYVDDGVIIGPRTKIWHFCHVLKGVTIGADCSLGQNVMIGPNVTMGRGCKIQNNVALYDGVELGDDVFCGPSCVFTNVTNPRANVARKSEFKRTVVGNGVAIGANATIICGNELGAWCFIGAGAVVTRTVVPHALMVGQPARRVGWMSHDGHKLDANLVCPRTAKRYRTAAHGGLEMIED